MVKKILFLFTFMFITFSFSLNVKAYTMSAPTSVACLDTGTCFTRENTTLSSYQDRNIYFSPYRMGGVSSQEYVKNLDFTFSNANLCSNQDLSISGVLASIYGFFTEQNYTVHVYSGNNELTCSYSLADPYHSINFSCYGKGGGTLQITVQQNSYSIVKQYEIGVSQEMNVSCDISNEAIVNQSITNTQNIINNNNSNTNQIIQDNQQNTQSIINSQNQNTQQEIESQKVCTNISSSYIIQSKSFLNTNGVVQSANNSEYGVTDFIDISSSTISLLQVQSNAGGSNYCFYDTDKVKLLCRYINSPLPEIPSNAKYFRTTIRNNLPIFKICSNGNQVLNDSINGLNDSITSDTPPDTTNAINSFNQSLADYTPITNLLTLPLTLINAYNQGINAVCSPYNFGNLYGTNIVLPCINLEQILGSNLWYTIDSLCCIFLIYSIAMLFVHAFDSLTSLKDDFDGMYVPKHAGKHVGSGLDG